MSEVLLQTRGLGVSFGGVHAVKAVDFTVHSGEVRCLIGPNGAGKSTFFKLLSGQLQPSRGDCHFRGRRISGLPLHRIARLGIGVKTQTPSVFDGLDVLENLRLAASRLQGPAEARATAEATLERIGLSELRQRNVGDLAHGQRQWVELGMILAARPALVLLDEPAAGMTHQEVRKTAALIKEINAHSTVIVVEHDMEFIRLIAGTVTVFNQGAILAQGSFAEVTQDPAVREAYLGKQEIKHA
ncbi:MAG: ATP-binding cassette domain-containing protein [Candidatus Pseudomonas colombiensis]|jgi:branched-chain amino acid transport system ATP-binding protein|uniref:ATP-binding cassette domain-containing protein n=1 Tax=Pseudomonas morbosilactucae TaxID=2938197 RepID=A0ABT0JQX1_9PSED|nr:ATP-binding cassette domain-containing protein [Pseudomonas morbosilactucae]MCK9818342.1 ATP-binding cassette domain-containing protein [Pseudomonas morbosilactucae]WEK07659.1 MAG: ATP-binding cassette domain-containing protein [Pseudomonas sp.]